VPAEHHDDGAPAAGGVSDGSHHGAEVPRHEDVGERPQEGTERAILSRRLREVVGADLVLADRDGDGAEGRKVGFGGRRGGAVV
jgi:hypothetical protein